VTLLNGGDAAAAESVLTAVRAAHARDVQTLYLLGRARERLGRTADAVAAYEAFAAQAPARLAAVAADARRRVALLRPVTPP
jgi:cytochrome c-type biogenesis protein CcmH/NrfG